jgi:hypothetical protein
MFLFFWVICCIAICVFYVANWDAIPLISSLDGLVLIYRCMVETRKKNHNCSHPRGKNLQISSLSRGASGLHLHFRCFVPVKANCNMAATSIPTSAKTRSLSASRYQTASQCQASCERNSNCFAIAHAVRTRSNVYRRRYVFNRRRSSRYVESGVNSLRQKRSQRRYRHRRASGETTYDGVRSYKRDKPRKESTDRSRRYHKSTRAASTKRMRTVCVLLARQPRRLAIRVSPWKHWNVKKRRYGVNTFKYYVKKCGGEFSCR